MVHPEHKDKLSRAALSLEGLSVGDAFGQAYFSMPPGAASRKERPGHRLYWTDDTAMAIVIFETLAHHGQILPEILASGFAERYRLDPDRGYGGMAHRILREIGAGQPWREVSTRVFGGSGSMGNGGAMRVAPLGAYFADDDIALLVENAKLSAEVTHAHLEGQAGAISVALAAAFAWRNRGQHSPRLIREFFEFILQNTPESWTRDGITKAMDLPRSSSPDTAISLLGNGSQVCAHETVPLTLWIAARHWTSFADALWMAAACGGDIDTNCAIVGGIVSLSDQRGVPAEWIAQRESLPVTLI